MINKLILFFIVLLIIPLIHAGDYGDGIYGDGNYGEIPVVTTPETPSGGGSSGGASISPTYECSENSDCDLNEYCFNHTCYSAECFDDSTCNTKEGEVCWDYRCVKLFDMEILEFESPVQVGEFFDFTYFLKAVAEINGDVEINFWIEKDGEIITSGLDTIYIGSFENKTKTKKLFLPSDVSSGSYTFYIQVTYGTYTATAHRTIGIDVKDGIATIKMQSDYSQYIIYGLITLGIFAVLLIFYIERKKIKKGLTKETKKIKRYKLSILTFSLYIILGLLIYYFKWYLLIIDWVPRAAVWTIKGLLTLLTSYWPYLLAGIIAIIIFFEIITLRKKIPKIQAKLKRESKNRL